MERKELVAALEEIALLLELKGENPFKVRAYTNGARILETLEGDLQARLQAGPLKGIKGIGDALASKIQTLWETGELPLLEQLRSETPAGLLEMTELSGLGPKKIQALRKELGVESIEALKEACETGQVAALKGFGKKTAEKLLLAIQHREAYAARHLAWEARLVAEPILAELRGLPQVQKAEVAGSLRRGRETVGDLDFIVASAEGDPILQWFVDRSEVTEVLAHGSTKASVRLAKGLQADLRVVAEENYPFALQYFTGSKEHNVELRSRALSRGWSLNEWGFSRKEGLGKPPFEEAAAKAAIRDETGLYEFLDLDFIPPELREGRGEIPAAEAGELPRLVEMADLKGVFHNHTVASDGRETLEEMAAAAAARGWEYLGLADHSKASFQANGLDEERLAQQLDVIRQLNARGDLPCRLFSGIECDILPDGSLDLDDAILRELDYVVVSVHSSFSQSEAEMTARIIRAIEHPCATMLGHLTGRLLLRREGYAVDTAKVIDAAIANGKIIELNANPLRNEMDWRLWPQAASRGLLCAINPDAHEQENFDYMSVGIQSARKGWLTQDSVINCLGTEEVLDLFAKIHGRKAS